MTQKNDTPILLLALSITIALLGGGFWWFSQRLDLGNFVSGGQPTSPPGTTLPGTSPPDATSTGGNPATPVQERLSAGDRTLFSEGLSADKQAGIEAIASGDYAQAVTRLEAALQANRNDPETLIYLNNARIGNEPAYTIAVAVPAATASNSALEILRGVAQAQTEVNQAGGMNGTPLKVVIVSDDNDPTTSTAVAETLVQNPDILGVVGHFGSDATLAAAPIYQQAGLVMVSPTSTSISLSEQGDAIFRTVPSDRFTATALSRYLVNTLQRQNAVVYFNSESAYSQSLKEEFTTAIYGDGGQILAEFDLANPAFDPGASLEQATQQDAEVIVLLSDTATLDPALQVIAVNRQNLPILGGDSLYNPKLLQVGGQAAEGMIVAVPWILLSDPQSPFAQESRQLWGGDVNWRTAMAYDAAQVLIDGLLNNPTRAGVLQTLNDSSFTTDGATGTIRFLPSGDRNQAMQLVIVEPGSRSGYGFDFAPVQ